MRNLLVLIIAVQAFAVTEQELILKALNHTYDIKISQSYVSQDSISLEQAKDGLLPSLTFSVNGDYLPFDSSSGTYYPEYGDQRLRGTASILASQPLSSGGRFSGNFTTNGNYFLETDSTQASNDLSLSFEQPLFREAWKNSNYRRNVTRNSIYYSIENEYNKETIINALSIVRNDLLEYAILFQSLTLLHERVTRAKEKHASMVTGFTTGGLVAEDTLVSFLSLLAIQQELLYLQDSFVNMQDHIKFLTGASVTEAVQLKEFTSQFPNKDTLLSRALQHPEFSVLSLLDSSLAYAINYRKNDMWPDIRAKGSYTRYGRDEHLFDDEESFRSAVSVGLAASFTIPLRRIRQDIARMQVEQQRNALQRDENTEDVQLEIDQLERLWKREQAIKAMLVQEAQAARDYLGIVSKKSTSSSGDRMEYLDAENQWYEASLASINQDLLLEKISVTLDRITGDVLSRYQIELGTTEESEEKRK